MHPRVTNDLGTSHSVHPVHSVQSPNLKGKQWIETLLFLPSVCSLLKLIYQPLQMLHPAEFSALKHFTVQFPPILFPCCNSWLNEKSDRIECIFNWFSMIDKTFDAMWDWHLRSVRTSCWGNMGNHPLPVWIHVEIYWPLMAIACCCFMKENWL